MHTMPLTLRFAALLLALTCLGTGCATDNPSPPNTPEAEFTPLFNGENLDGWFVVGGDATFRVQDGEIVANNANTKQNAFLRTRETYGDFEFRCQFKWDQPGNSGIQFRSHQWPSTQRRDANRVYGYQFELDASDRAWSGGLYEEGRRGWIVDLKGDKKAFKRDAIDLDGWNDIIIECRGNRIRTWLNGVSIVNHRDTDGEFPLMEGFFALQAHASKPSVMRWRDLRIKTYPREDD